jgi:hypothetical protein
MTAEDLGRPLFGVGLVQPDRRTCGSASLVAARMLNDPDYARSFLDAGSGSLVRFRTEVMALHRRTNGLLDSRGRLQLPWPRALGTAPWSLVRQLSTTAGVHGTTYGARLVLPHQRARAFAAVRAAVGAGHATPLYVGNRWGPRHVVLAVASAGDGVRIYDPASGRRYPISRRDYLEGTLDVAGWQVPWIVVLPHAMPAAR